MITQLRSRSVYILIGLAVSLVGGSAQAETTYAEAWKLATTSVWPPAVMKGKVVLKNGDTLTAYSLKNGSKVWSKKLTSLRYGAGVMDAGKEYIYVLGGKALYLLDPKDGKVKKKARLNSPSYVLHRGGSVYVVTKEGVLRLNRTGDRIISKAKRVSGEIRGADGHYVVLYNHTGEAKRLIVVNLKTGKKSYEFKLLPRGWHRVVKTEKGRVVFLDYSQKKDDGSNAKKLYFTEADYVRSKKIKDKALHKRFPASYPTSSHDTFWTATDASGIVFIGNHGSRGEGSNLLAYDPNHDKLLWNRSGSVLSMGLLLHKGRLWSGVTDRDGAANAVAYSPDDGSLLVKLPVDAAGTGKPVAAGDRVLFRTRSSIYCFAPRKTAGAVVKTGSGGAKPRGGWRLYRDRTAGYLIQAPKTWRFHKKKLIKMGGVRMSVPFVRTEVVGGKTKYLGSVHVLTWEAAGRDVNTLWNSVYTQRRRTNPDVRVLKVNKLNNIGGTGLAGIRATYSFRSKTGYPVQMRSMCVVSHGVAFELRGWAGPQKPAEIWQEIHGIFNSFSPRRFR